VPEEVEKHALMWEKSKVFHAGLTAVGENFKIFAFTFSTGKRFVSFIPYRS